MSSQQTSRKKFLWMDGSVHTEPDPNWNQEKAINLGLVKRNTTSKVDLPTQRRAHIMFQPEIQVSLGSLAFEDSYCPESH